MNKLPFEKRVAVVSALVEGCSLRSTVRMTGVALNTIQGILADVGIFAREHQSKVMQNLPCENLQIDEIWCFCGAKERNIPKYREDEEGIGDVWTFAAIDAQTKLVPCWHVGERDIWCAREFISDVASRLSGRVQLTTDGLGLYMRVVREVFGADGIDFAQLEKIYGREAGAEKRYSPAVCLGCVKKKRFGDPDPKQISTSYVERQNLTMRMNMRRFTRLTNGFSKKIQNLRYSVALHFMHYNFVRRHQTLKTTPAIAAGVDIRQWTMEDLVEQSGETKTVRLTASN